MTPQEREMHSKLLLDNPVFRELMEEVNKGINRELDIIKPDDIKSMQGIVMMRQAVNKIAQYITVSATDNQVGQFNAKQKKRFFQERRETYSDDAPTGAFYRKQIMSQPDEGAVELSTVSSAAQEIERRMSDVEPPEEIQEEELPADMEEMEVEAEEVEEDVEPEEDEAEPTYESINQLAEAMGLTTDEFLNTIKATRKIDGIEEEVTLAELRAGNQRDADYRKKTTELAELKKATEAEYQQKSAVLTEKLAQADRLLANAENEIAQEYNSIDWNELEQNDPDEWTRKRLKFQERYNAVQNKKQALAQEFNNIRQEQQVKQQEAIKARIAEEYNTMLSVIPEWENTETRNKENAEISDYLVSIGFKPEEIAYKEDGNGNIVNPGITDHRFMLLARDAAKYRNKAQNVDASKKKVVPLPKFVKPGAKQSKNEKRLQVKKTATDRFMKTGSRDDLVAAMLERSK